MTKISDYPPSIVDRKNFKVTGTIKGISFLKGSLMIKLTGSLINSTLVDGIDDGGTFDRSWYRNVQVSTTLSVEGLDGSLENEYRNNLYCDAQLITDDNLSLECQLIIDSDPSAEKISCVVYKGLKELDLHTLFGFNR